MIGRGFCSVSSRCHPTQTCGRISRACARSGFRLVTLTNSGTAAIKAQLQNAGLANCFEESISVDAVKRFKPHLAVYRTAATHLGAQPGELRLIAAHAWDVYGAMRAGWRAAFVARQGIPLFPLAPKPDIIGPALTAVTDAILNG